MSREKVVIQPFLQGNLFLKTPDEVAELFGFSTSIRSKVKLLSRGLQKEVKLSDRSLDNLGGKGISKLKAEEAFEPIYSALEDKLNLDFESLIPEGTRTSDIHVLWPAAIKSFVCGAQFSEQEKSCLQPLVAFIERRCREYEPQREWVTNFRAIEYEGRLRHLTDFYMPVINKMLLDSTQQDAVMKILSMIALGDKVKVEKEDVKALCLFFQDFNLSLFVSLDLVARNFALLVDDASKQDESFLAQILAAEGQCYFGKLIAFIKIKTGCTYSKLAQLIPVQYQSTDSGRTESEAKVERLKEWRKGKTKPSFAVMDEFFSHFDVADQIPLLIYGFICQSIDRMIDKYKLEDDRALLREIYSAKNYSRYYDK
ncbi:TPA: hypothetical protein ACGUXS_004829 [Vibrio vulnificus]